MRQIEEISYPEYFSFYLPLLEFSALKVALPHSLVKLFSKFIKKISTAVVLATFHIHIDIVAVLRGTGFFNKPPIVKLLRYKILTTIPPVIPSYILKRRL